MLAATGHAGHQVGALVWASSLMPNRLRKFFSSLTRRNRDGSNEALDSEALHESAATSGIISLLEKSRSRLAERIAELKQADKTIANVSSKQIIGGMRGVPALIWETSSVDPESGIKYRGRPIQSVVNDLPKLQGHTYPTIEAFYWMLLTGEVPSVSDIQTLIVRLNAVKDLDADVPLQRAIKVIDSADSNTMSPMTQLSLGVLAMQGHSNFEAAYRRQSSGKGDVWHFHVYDSLDLLARLHILAAFIFRKHEKGDMAQFAIDVGTSTELDWAARLAFLMTGEKPLSPESAAAIDADLVPPSAARRADFLRLYMILHADHEGGNVSAYTSHVVGSAMSDVYQVFTSAMCGLAGPLHGRANQDSLEWVRLTFDKLVGKNVVLLDTPELREKVQKAASEWLASGKVIPGYGHAVLRQIDPRYTTIKFWYLQNAADIPLGKFNLICSEEIPKVLGQNPKISNPYPNIDCCSGSALCCMDICWTDFFTVLFGVSRALGVTANLILARMLELPITRPKSLTLDQLETISNASTAKTPAVVSRK